MDAFKEGKSIGENGRGRGILGTIGQAGSREMGMRK